MKLIIKVIVIIFISLNLIAREKGETEITTEDGIEVFQNEKFYLLKKNVKIQSDEFTLNADDVKIDFDKSLYDITKLNAQGDVNFYSEEYDIKGDGEYLEFEVKIEKILVRGQNSKLITKDVQMFSDGFIEVNNQSGKFSLKGLNSKLINEDVIIEARSIDGVFSDMGEKKNIILLNVFDEQISYIKNYNTDMYAKKINYNNKNSIIELIDNVTIIRNEEKITGDYGTLDTTNNSYKIKSKNQSKVKVVIQNNEQ
tara:strand:- start:947 stop:1711 length:765 start_codon:yes stop_codon:yes gene_type:complete